MYRWIRPKIAVPVHGEMRHHGGACRAGARSLQVPQALVPENGQMFRLAPGRAELIDEVPSGRIHLDGRVLVAEGEGLAKDRRAMGFAGLIVITLVVDHKGRIAAPAHGAGRRHARAGGRGGAEGGGRARSTRNKRSDPDDLAENVRRAARRAAHDAWGKKPITRVLVSGD